MRDKSLFPIFGYPSNGIGLPKVCSRQDIIPWLLLTLKPVAGNSMWGSPTQLLYHVLKAKPALTYPEFKRVLDSLMKNVRPNSDPAQLHPLATSLWMGEKIWKYFARDLHKIHLNRGNVPPSWEKRGDSSLYAIIYLFLTIRPLQIRRIRSIRLRFG
jgi:hypothetical protein